MALSRPTSRLSLVAHVIPGVLYGGMVRVFHDLGRAKLSLRAMVEVHVTLCRERLAASRPDGGVA